jgi:hypothetical protein
MFLLKVSLYKLGDLTSKFYKSLDLLQTSLLLHPSHIELVQEYLNSFFQNTLVTKTKLLFDFIMNWLINIFYKLEDKEKENVFLNIFSHNLTKSNFSKLEIDKKFSLEDNYLFKFLSKGSELYNKENLQRIYYIWDLLQKKMGGVDKNKEKKLKSKNKKIFDMLFNLYDKQLLDLIFILIFQKIKSNPNKLDIDLEKFVLKSMMKTYFGFGDYIFSLITLPFDVSQTLNFRKIILFLTIIIVKTLAMDFLKFIFIYFKNLFKDHKKVSQIMQCMDFEIINDPMPFSLQGSDSNKSYLKSLEYLIVEFLGTHNIKIGVEKNEDSLILERLNVLKELILCFELYLCLYKFSAVYNFYYSIQIALIDKFKLFPDNKKKIFFEVQVNLGNIQVVLQKYNENYPELNNLVSQILSVLNSSSSLIFYNWLIFLFKNGTILDAYKTLKFFLLTKKEGEQIFLLLRMPYEISKFYPTLWK